MGLPNMTLVYLKNWLKRFGASEKTILGYERSWTNIDKPNSNAATPIPCPNCFLLSGTFGDGLKQTGDKLGLGVDDCLRCPTCNEVFPMTMEITQLIFDDACNQGGALPYLDFCEEGEMWMTQDDGLRKRVTIDLLKARIKNGHW
jgi:hypothetical protein